MCQQKKTCEKSLTYDKEFDNNNPNKIQKLKHSWDPHNARIFKVYLLLQYNLLSTYHIDIVKFSVCYQYISYGIC